MPLAGDNDEFFLANHPRSDVGNQYPGYGNDHGFDFYLSIGRASSAVLIQAQALNGTTPFTISGSVYLASAWNGTTPPPGDDAFWSPFYGGTVSRSQIGGLTKTYRIVDGFTPSTPSQTSIAGAINLGVGWYTNNAGSSVKLHSTTATPTVAITEVPYPGNGHAGDTALWNGCLANGCRWSSVTSKVYPDIINQWKSNYPGLTFSLFMQQVVVHEVGHAIGLEHDNLADNGAGFEVFVSVMDESVPLRNSSGAFLTGLTAHDLNKLAKLYPNCGSNGYGCT